MMSRGKAGSVIWNRDVVVCMVVTSNFCVRVDRNPPAVMTRLGVTCTAGVTSRHTVDIGHVSTATVVGCSEAKIVIACLIQLVRYLTTLCNNGACW
jgi:hypothetical protein